MLGRPWQVCVGGLGLAPRGEGWLSFGVWMAWSHEALPIPGLLAGRVWVGQWASSQQGKGLTGPSHLFAFQAPEASGLGTHSPEGETEATITY